MEQAVPRHDAAKDAAEIQSAHIGDDPILRWKTLPAHCNQGWCGIHTGDRMTGRHEIGGDRSPGAAPDIEHFRTGTYMSEESAEPSALAVQPNATPFRVPQGRGSLIQVDDAIRCVSHGKNLCQLRIRGYAHEVVWPML